ncbi:MAG: c-type cytochrome [Saprospiraceae bacterium]|nr:c-type cytochrome [Saprospiraceae bacterium]
MKKILILLAVAAMYAACSSNESAPATDTEASAEKPKSMVAEDITTNPDYMKGKELIAKNDCLTCHKDHEKLVGPAYKDVAAKYASDPNAIEGLAEKVMKGGTGVWGQVPMAAHPNLSKEDAVALVKYIMLIK